MRAGLIEARKKQGMTQDAVAKKIGVTRTCYANYESGLRNPSFEKVIRLKKVLSIEEDSIFFGQ